MFICSCCNYETLRKDAFDRHKLSKRHISNIKNNLLSSIQEVDNEDIDSEQQNDIKQDGGTPIYICNKCGKKYKTKSSFVNHYDKCNFVHSLQCPKCMKCFKHNQSKLRHIKNNNCKPIVIHDAHGVSNIDIVPENYIYLLQLREFKTTHQFVYKIGKTKQNHLKRFHQYPKGSKLIMQYICNNCDEMEKKLLKDFAEKYIHRKDIGKEYFEGNFVDMIQDINNKILCEYMHIAKQKPI